MSKTMKLIKSLWKFIAGFIGALVVLWFSTRTTKHIKKAAQHREVNNQLRALETQSSYLEQEIYAHYKKAVAHNEEALNIKSKAEILIKQIKSENNETINTLVDRWNNTD